jgi:hypothetical protein
MLAAGSVLAWWALPGTLRLTERATFLLIPPKTLAAWQQAWMVYSAVVSAVLISSGPPLGCVVEGLWRRNSESKEES